MSRLEILSGCRAGEFVELGFAELDIGNRKKAGISVRDPWISWKHARIVFENGQYAVEDLNSRNGTWFRGKKIERQDLNNGDVFLLGKTKVRFQGDVEAGAQARPALKAAAAPALKAAAGSVEEERDELRRMKDVLERFLDVTPDERAKVIAATKRPEAVVDDAAVATEQAKVQKLQGDLDQQRGRADKLEQETVDLRRQLEDLRESEQKVGAATGELEAKLTGLKGELAGNESALGEAQEKTSSLESRVELLESDRGELQRRLDEAEMEVRHKVEAYEELKGKLSASEASAVDSGRLIELEVEVKQLNEKLAQKDIALQAATAAASESRESSSSVNEELERNLRIAEKTVATQEKQVSDLQAKLQSDIEKATNTLNKELRVKSRALEDIQREKRSLDEKCRQLESQGSGDDGGARAGQLEAELNALRERARAEALEREQKLSETQAALEQMRQEAATLESAAASGDVEGGKVAALEVQIERFKEERDAARAEAAETRKEIDEISMEQIELEEELERFKAQLEGKA